MNPIHFILFSFIFLLIKSEKYASYYIWQESSSGTGWDTCTAIDNWSVRALYELDVCGNLAGTDKYALHTKINETEVTIKTYLTSDCSGSIIDELTLSTSDCFNVSNSNSEDSNLRTMLEGFKNSRVMETTVNSVDGYMAALYSGGDEDCQNLDPVILYPNPSSDFCIITTYFVSIATNQFYCRYWPAADDIWFSYYMSIGGSACDGTPSDPDSKEKCLYGQYFFCHDVCNGIGFDEENVCGGHGECVSYNECSCESKWQGDYCEECIEGYYNAPYCNVTKCFGIFSNNDTICSSNGECTSLDNCVCDDDYYGKECEYYQMWKCGDYFNNDTESVCSGEGQCQKPSENSYEGECECNDDFYGDFCEIDGLYCFGLRFNESGVCTNKGNCTDFDTCTCEEGYYGEKCNITKCFNVFSNQSNVCNSHGTCNLEGICECEKNWDIDEKCSYTVCYDINGNNDSVCSGNGVCRDLNTCDCEYGYDGEDCKNFQCFEVNSTSDEVCSGIAECENFNLCDCPETNKGPNCELCINDDGCPIEEEKCYRNRFAPISSIIYVCSFVEGLIAQSIGNTSIITLNKTESGSFSGKFISFSYTEKENSEGEYIDLALDCALSDCSKTSSSEWDTAYYCDSFSCGCNDKNPICESARVLLASFQQTSGEIRCNKDGSCAFYESSMDTNIKLNCVSSECSSSSNSLSTGLIGVIIGVPVALGIIILIGIFVTILIVGLCFARKRRKVTPSIKMMESKKKREEKKKKKDKKRKKKSDKEKKKEKEAKKKRKEKKYKK